ncbi:MAG: 16S rRNA (cytosine(1402)-N(4))-methyltransferase RsmH [Gemmatimonadota bacterium]
MSTYHEPVFLDSCLELLLQGKGGEDAPLYLDGTVGGGGHARALLERCPQCHLVAVDRDPTALEEARRVLEPYGTRVRFLQLPFHEAPDAMGLPQGSLAGVLLDLGVSSHQLDALERGFTFREGAPLDMRMAGDQGEELPAWELLNRAGEEELTQIFRHLAEEPRARPLARAVVRRRDREPFRTSDDLVGALTAVLGRGASTQEKARVFQGIRIAVNRELESLEEALPRFRDALQGGGMLVVIAYHSLEDRIVKHAFREWSRQCVCPPELPVCRCRGRALGTTVTRKPLTPDVREMEANPRSRSAKLRAWRKAA